ncbi:transcription factor E2F8 isoform X2 [Accipiter gentilis]|uniref:transcription factor E2F8 isoform X2 n=1 Tax=Astur gentilis TaxID=8957 RepID=UPI0021101F75|nr:transcription factor E2F8 isoform X2 [Accipiter gentilis]
MQKAGGEMGTGDKENHSSEPHRSVLKTPLKQAATSRSVLTEIQPDCQPLTTPPKPKEILPADPWTPTSNLKMLISAASPEIRSREQRRELSNNSREVLQAKHCLQEHLSGDEYEKSQPSRKEKSLGLLCHKFLARYPDYPSTAENNYICLDEVAEELNVERRRIYDIVNVLESLHMVSRLAKNRYAWHGRHNLSKTLQALKKVGEENKYTQQIQMIKKREYEHEFDLDGESNEEMARSFGSNEHSEMSFVELPGMEFRAGTDQNLSALPSKMAQVPAIAKHQLEGQSKKAKELKLSRSALESNQSSPEVVPKPEPPRVAAPSQQPALAQPPAVCPPSHSSVSPVILPHTPAGVSYAIYLHPSQAHTVTTYSPSFMLQPLPCANVTGIKSINSKVLNKTATEEGDNQVTTDDPTKSLAAKEGPPIKSETSSQRCLKRSQALQENNLIKKCRSDEESLDTSLGGSMKNERPPSSSSQMNRETDNFQEERQNKTETLDENMASCYDQHKRDHVPEDEDKIKTKQDIPVAFAIPAHESFFPSGYLIPLTQCTHGNKAGFSNKEKAGMCSLQHTTYSSPIAGVIPVTASELKAVNIPAFQITPLNIMLSPTSIAAAPVLSNSCLNSSNTSSAQNPSSSVLNFTLQHIGLIPAGVQVPANPVLQHMPVSLQPENVSYSSENMNLQEEKPSVPKELQEPQTVTENFFRTPGGPNTVSSLSANSDGTDRISQGTLYIPQRKLEVSED